MANMEELHMAALASYSNASNELRQLVQEFFNSMDTNGDRVVIFDEFVEFIGQNVNIRADRNFFRCLDRNGDGLLDFNEVLTFYYILKTRGVWCAYCRNYQTGVYFTCVACFDNARSTGHTYDLCSACYEARRHQLHHPHHNYFLDSHVLLRAKAGLPLLVGAPNPNVWCDYCRNYQTGLYFTCVACFDNARSTGHTYDLCSACYEARRHQQHHPHHNYFLDSYVLLRVKAGFPLLAGAPNLQQALVPRGAPNTTQQALVPRGAPNTTQQALVPRGAPNTTQQALVPRGAPNTTQQALVPRGAPNTTQQRMRTAFQALEMALSVVTAAVELGCSIM